MRQFQCVLTTYDTKIKDTYFEIYTKQVSCPLALPPLNISNCKSVLEYLSLYHKLFIYSEKQLKDIKILLTLYHLRI